MQVMAGDDDARDEMLAREFCVRLGLDTSQVPQVVVAMQLARQSVAASKLNANGNDDEAAGMGHDPMQRSDSKAGRGKNRRGSIVGADGPRL